MSEQIITTLKFPDNIRKRPGMYIGATDQPSHILMELVDNFKDEGLLGYATKGVVITKDTYCVVSDNGRGVPIYTKEDSGNPAIIDIYSSSHTGGKFDDDGSDTTVGMNGIGSKATNALSKVFNAYVNLNKKSLDDPNFPVEEWISADASKLTFPVLKVKFERGILISCSVVEFESLPAVVQDSVTTMITDWGTSVYFEPDPEIWESVTPSFDINTLRISSLFLDGKMSMIVNGEESRPYSLDDRYPNCKLIDLEGHKYFTLGGDASTGETICRYLIQLGFSGESFDSRMDGSVNTVHTPSGMHVNLASRGVAKAISEISGTLSQSDCYYSMRMFTLVMTNRAMFNSQTKEHLSSIAQFNPNDLMNSVRDEFTNKYNSNNQFRKLIDTVIERLIEYRKTLGNMSITEQVTTEIVTGNDSRSNLLRNTKVLDCNTFDRSKAELFIVEGDSAAGSLIQGRDREYHAIMPIRGKSLNATASSIDELLDNVEFKSLFNVIGAGIHPYNVDIEACRYGKVVITADADADGAHIKALLLGAFGVHLPQLIESGILYVAETPLYEQDGKFYLASERHMMDENKHIIRNKGLGGMDPEDISEFLFTDRRELIQVTIDGIDDAIELVRSSEAKWEMAVSRGLVKDDNNA